MTEKKRQDLPSILVVATPIGNLADASPRVKEALESASAVLCEDTRRTSRLVAALGIRPRLERFDAHASEGRVAELVGRMRDGETFALVSDAGTPGISDPAAELVRAVRESGLSASPVPGPSAVAALLSVSGFASAEFAFRGFFPRKKGDREREVAMASACEAARVFVWFESPERVEEALAAFAAAPAGTRAIAGKELTKLHERFFAGTAAETLASVSAELAREGNVGEWCFAVEFPPLARVESSEWVKALRCLLDARVPASEAAKRVSQYFDVRKNAVYEEALRISSARDVD